MLAEVVVNLFEDKDFFGLHLEIGLDPKVDLKVDIQLNPKYNFCKYQ